jgi:hypothetical protein
MFYSYTDDPSNFIAVPVSRVKQIMEMNLAGEKPDVLLSEKELPKVVKQLDYENVVGQDSLTRFDSDKRKKKKKKKPGTRPAEGVQGNVVASANIPEGGSLETVQQPRPNNPPQQNRPQQSRPPQQNRPPQQAGGQNQRPNNNPNKRPNNGPRPPRPQQPPQS